MTSVGQISFFWDISWIKISTFFLLLDKYITFLFLKKIQISWPDIRFSHFESDLDIGVFRYSSFIY